MSGRFSSSFYEGCLCLAGTSRCVPGYYCLASGRIHRYTLSRQTFQSIEVNSHSSLMIWIEIAGRNIATVVDHSSRTNSQYVALNGSKYEVGITRLATRSRVGLPGCMENARFSNVLACCGVKHFRYVCAYLFGGIFFYRAIASYIHGGLHDLQPGIVVFGIAAFTALFNQ